MDSKQTIKTLFFISSIIILSFYYNTRELKKIVNEFEFSIGVDEITLNEARFKDVKAILPKQGVVGYISDKFEDPNDDTKAFYLTQYAIAPLIVVRGKNRPLVVGNFKISSDKEAYNQDSLILSKDFGNGVLLFRRKDH